MANAGNLWVLGGGEILHGFVNSWIHFSLNLEWNGYFEFGE